MTNIKGDFFVQNGEIKSTKLFTNELIVGGKSLYEVIRINNNIPLFPRLHYQRLSRSGKLTGISVPTIKSIGIGIRKLLELNKIGNGNIELVVNDIEKYSLRFVPHYYPTRMEYKQGIRTMTYEAFRENPNAKVKLLEFRKRIDDFIAEQGIYEILFLHENKILEGSRSNAFFIKGNEVFTAPIHGVLPGITRSVVIDICKKLKYNIIEEELKYNELHKYQSAFLTGTSPGVLPIKWINDIGFIVKSTILEHIMQEFSHQTGIKI
jgi:branched-chain amino acid aminotransferase